ncbi:uncharacterized protein [Argopecten irradians]|uniref:uncharacterized protein n=1 Tax=Argopecten irradians TaxID=31199 RepID=UPI00371E3E35
MAASLWRMVLVSAPRLVNPMYRFRSCHKCLQTDLSFVDRTVPSSHHVYGRPICLTSIHYSSVRDEDVKKMMDVLTDKFTDARELMQDARDSQGTVYFSDDMAEAQEAVNDTLEEYSSLLSKLDDTQKQNVVRTIGLRMEELKAQQAALEEALKD